MKTYAYAAIALAGLSTTALGQSLSVNLSWDNTLVGFGETATATVSASFTGMPAGAYLSSVNIDLIASGPFGEVSNVAAVAWNNAGLGFDGQGTASGADIFGINASQFSLIPPITAGSPILITTFEVVYNVGGFLSYSAQVADGAPFAFSVTGGAFADQPMAFGVDVFSSQTLGVPAPGAFGVLALGLGVAGRRRRAG